MASFCSSYRSTPTALLLALLLLLVLGKREVVVCQLGVGFYGASCPDAEALVSQVVSGAFLRDPSIAASLVRLLFHDCFVQGCDASILLDGGTTEKSATSNQGLRGFEVIDEAKAALEASCPGIVSCADIIGLAARDAIVLSGGPTWQVPTGRRDGRVSSALLATLSLPLPTFPTPVLTQIFMSHGLSQDEMITLSGAHTIGRAHCSSFSNRLAMNDPTLEPTYGAALRQACPINVDPLTTVPLDPSTPFTFDNNYFSNLAAGRGLLTSDQDLYTNLGTQFASNLNLINPDLWRTKFSDAMIHLSMLNVNFGTLGEIRKNCRVVN